MRTLKDLTNYEKNALRTLVYNMDGENYDESYLAQQFNVTPRTVAALKSHRTMGTYDN